jgi:DNA-binding Xre family transcriptional regulator
VANNDFRAIIMRLRTFIMQLRTLVMRLMTLVMRLRILIMRLMTLAMQLKTLAMRLRILITALIKLVTALILLKLFVEKCLFLKNKRILTMMNYRLKALMESKGIAKPYASLMKMGLNHTKVVRLLRNDNVQLDKRTMNILCEALWCTPNDLFEWIPEHSAIDQASHPLQALKPKEVYAIQKDIQKLTPAQLSDLKTKMDELLGGKKNK